MNIKKQKGKSAFPWHYGHNNSEIEVIVSAVLCQVIIIKLALRLNLSISSFADCYESLICFLESRKMRCSPGNSLIYGQAGHLK